MGFTQKMVKDDLILSDALGFMKIIILSWYTKISKNLLYYYLAAMTYYFTLLISANLFAVHE